MHFYRKRYRNGTAGSSLHENENAPEHVDNVIASILCYGEFTQGLQRTFDVYTVCNEA